ncbi:MAG: hypothetical protein IKU61_00360 [Clostridia bacterium]|nr:hypothetical protein [Clostridia bacterium]
MTKKTSLLSKVYLALALFFTIAGTVVRFNLMQSYDVANGFYTNDTLHKVFAYTLAAIVILLAAVSYIYIKEEKCSKLPKEGVLVKGASLLSGCALGGFIVYVFAKAVIPSLGGIDGFDIATLAFCAVAMLYYFTLDKKAPFRSLLCAASAIVLLTFILALYFDRGVSFVNHSVMLCFAAAIFSALTFTAEANFPLGRAAYHRYIAYAPSAIILSFAISIPDIVFCIEHRLAPLTDIYYDVILLVFGLYHLARLAEIAFYKEEK